jgi:thymidylate synthase (FAD)
MKFILQPRVELVGQTQFIEHPTYKIPADGDDHVRLGAFAAKGCYDSYGEGGRANVANQQAILEHRHGSVMEHSTVSLFIEGVTRGLTLELNRHRTFAISQRSTRYTKEEDSAMVLEPFYSQIMHRLIERYPEWFTSAPIAHSVELQLHGKILYWDLSKLVLAYTWPDHRDYDVELDLIYCFYVCCKSSVEDYAEQVELLESMNPLNLEGFSLRKWARGKARNVLPHALETRGTWTNNHRGWRWFIESRSDIHAEPEIRLLAYTCWKALVNVAPVYYEDFEIAEIYDNIPLLVPINSKV